MRIQTLSCKHLNPHSFHLQPAAAATLGLVPFLILVIGIGLIAIYTSLHVGEMGVRYPEVASYGDAGRVLAGRWGYEVSQLLS